MEFAFASCLERRLPPAVYPDVSFFIEFSVPTLSRRVAAEFLDFIVLFTFKMVMVWIFMNSIGLR